MKVALAVAAVLASVQHASAFCGFYVAGSADKLTNDATQVVLMREGTRTVLSMQNDYRGPLEDFAMVIPVPTVLQEANVKTLDRALFDHVDQMGAPRLVEYWEQDPCARPADYADAGVRTFSATGSARRASSSTGSRTRARRSRSTTR